MTEESNTGLEYNILLFLHVSVYQTMPTKHVVICNSIQRFVFHPYCSCPLSLWQYHPTTHTCRKSSTTKTDLSLLQGKEYSVLLQWVLNKKNIKASTEWDYRSVKQISCPLLGTEDHHEQLQNMEDSISETTNHIRFKLG